MVRHTLVIILEIRRVLLFGRRDQGLIRLWQGASDSLSEAESNLLLQSADHESFLGVYYIESYITDPTEKSMAAPRDGSGRSHHSVHFQVKPKLLK